MRRGKDKVQRSQVEDSHKQDRYESKDVNNILNVNYLYSPIKRQFFRMD